VYYPINLSISILSHITPKSKNIQVVFPILSDFDAVKQVSVLYARFGGDCPGQETGPRLCENKRSFLPMSSLNSGIIDLL